MLRHGNAAPTRPERVVVMGAGGFVGNAIAARLERDGATVMRLGRREVDLLTTGAAERLLGLLRAGDVLVAASALAPCRTPQMLRDNMVMAAALVAACAAPLAQIVNISSDAVYADCPEPLTEVSSKAPDSLHGAMHLAREIMFRNTVSAPLAILRPSLLYGAADPHNGYGPNRFLRLVERGDPIVLFGKGEEQRDHVLIDDAAELAARVIYRRSTGALNVATGTVTSFRDVAEMVARYMGRSTAILETPRTQPMPHNGYRPFDIASCRAAFPDFVFTPLAEGLRRTIADRREPAERRGA
ncbi:MAG: NAD(P)-dependent oxidoreductase [Alphaproteobacteria bacterium]|nr:NAD(P)-dependent oxidoreductase [Alphaproteobacteria bacterium]